MIVDHRKRQLGVAVAYNTYLPATGIVQARTMWRRADTEEDRNG
jgi:hypothetical protein